MCASSKLLPYLAYENVRGESGVCTGLAHGCAAVQQSRYGKLFGVPVSVPGLGLYAVLSLAAIAWASNWRGLRPLAAVAGFYGALFGVVFSAYLTWIEAFVLDAWCVYCVASALLVVVLCLFWSAALAIEVRSARLRRSGAAVPRPDLRPLPPSVRPGRRR